MKEWVSAEPHLAAQVRPGPVVLHPPSTPHSALTHEAEEPTGSRYARKRPGWALGHSATWVLSAGPGLTALQKWDHLVGQLTLMKSPLLLPSPWRLRRGHRGSAVTESLLPLRVCFLAGAPNPHFLLLC